SFWRALRERTPCYTESIRDSCNGRLASEKSCTKLQPNTSHVGCGEQMWMNYGSESIEDWRDVKEVKCDKGDWMAQSNQSTESIAVKSRQLLCATDKPTHCDPKEVINACETECEKLNVTRQEATCSAKLWLSEESALTNNWEVVDQMFCSKGNWKWTVHKDATYRNFENRKLACTFETPQHYKIAFWITVGGSVVAAIIIILVILIVVICCFCCRKKKSRKSGKSNTLTKTEFDGVDSSLGVKISAKKFKQSAWSWSRETPSKPADSSYTGVSSTIQESSQEEEKKPKNKKAKRVKTIDETAKTTNE
ncbi:hypothetical protein PFISCL1PPCAC_3851, partial [Pristionchus fissidentatus]